MLDAYAFFYTPIDAPPCCSRQNGVRLIRIVESNLKLVYGGKYLLKGLILNQ
jgi:hypothetical protein